MDHECGEIAATMSLHRAKIVFVGDFWEYYFKALLLLFVSAFTLGILIPYWIYWNVRYFSRHLEIELPDSGVLVKK